MIALRSDALLAVWEENHDAHPIRRALAILHTAWPDVSVDNWARAPIGQRDCSLLGLRETLFGGALATTTRCPCCAEQLESAFTTGDIRVRSPAAPVAPPPQQLREQGYTIEYRLPNSEDLLQIAASGLDREAGAAELLRRCILDAQYGDEVLDPTALPSAIVSVLGDRMKNEDPEAEIGLGFTCPGCGHAWRATFDIVDYLWAELDDWAHQVLIDVHVLAGAYGWSEPAILALSPIRRRLYIDIVHA